MAVLRKDYMFEISKGNIENNTNYRQFGYRSSIPTTLSDITESGVTSVNMPTTALAMEVVSSSASDAGVLLVSGTATGGSTTTLVDSAATFISSGVVAGDFVMNDTCGAFAIVLTIESENKIIFADPLSSNCKFDVGDSYRIADKSAGGVGGQVVEIHGLNKYWEEIEEFVITDGTTPVSTVHEYLRINNFHTMFAGAALSVGDIDVRQVLTPANIMDRIGAGGNMSLQALYTVPAGYTAYITDWSAGSDGTKAVRFILRATTDFSDRNYLPYVFHFQDVIMSDGSGGQHIFRTPLKCPAKSSIKISGNALSTTSGGACGFGFVLIKN